MGRIFPRLSSPIRVGSLTLRNRMMTTSMSPGAGYVEDNRPTRQFLNYLEERAAGETDVIVVAVAVLGAAVVHVQLETLEPMVQQDVDDA